MRGFRFRLHSAKVFGRPDIILQKHRAVVFVHGCFWHRHDGCRYATNPSTRPEFWQKKFASNAARDKAVEAALLKEQWRVATVWECALRKPNAIESTANLLAAWLLGNASQITIGEKDTYPTII